MANELIKAMETESFTNAYQVLSRDPNSFVSAAVLRQVMPNLGVMLTDVEVDQIIHQVKPNINDDGQINCIEFVKIVKFIKEPTVENQLKKIYEVLVRDQTRKIVLYGKPGVGKTWMARQIAYHAKKKENFDVAIWIYLNSGLNLSESIAYQLPPQPDSEKSEANQVWEIIRKVLKKKKLLLILDDEGSIVKDGKYMSELVKQLHHNQLQYKLLITKIHHEPSSEAIGIMVMPLTQDESTSLLGELLDKSSKIKDLAFFFVGKSRRLYAEVLIIAKIVNYFGQTDSGLKKLQSVMEVLSKEDGPTLDDSDYSNVIQLLISEYELLPSSVLIDCYSSETPENHFFHERGMVHFSELISYWILEGHLGHFHSIEDAYEKGHHVLMELVDYGILKHVKDGYVVSKGTKFNFDIHAFCKKFQSIRLGLATAFDNKLGSVALADGMMKTISSGQERKEISTLLLDGNRIGELGSLELADETMQFQSGLERKEISTYDRNRNGEVPDNLFKSMKELENLAIFNPTCKPFPLPLYEMKKLRLLVLRGCKFFKSVEDIFIFTKPKVPEKSQQKVPRLQRSQSAPPPQISDPDTSHSTDRDFNHLAKLTVLEISGPSSLTIPVDLFERMSNLKSLNLSFLQIELLPESLYSLSKIEFLILRGCSCLKKIGTLKNFKDLQVLDLSGATSFETFEDKSFSGNMKLQILNLSQSMVTKLPLVYPLEKLKYLSLSECTDLCRLRKIGALKKLQILDMSGAKMVEEFLDPSLETLESLVVLNVSGTAVRRIPSNIGSPRYLYLRHCSQLKQLPHIETLRNVQVLDLSGSVHLEDIKEEFIKSLKCVKELNLSKTSVMYLPSLSSLGNLRRLLLSDCQFLKKLEGLSSLKELEFLDLSGCKALLELEDKFFDKMNCLHFLNLSEIQLEKLPSLSNLMNLKELYLRNCPKLTHVPGLQSLSELEVLDYFRTPLKLPSFDNPACKPRVLGPSSSSSEDFDPQKFLKDLGVVTEELPSDTSKSTPLQQHEQENKETQVGGDEKEKLPKEEMNQCDWCISSWLCGTHVNQETIGVPVNGVHFLRLLKMYPSLFEKNIRQFHFFVYREEGPHTQFADKVFRINELDLRDIYLEQVSQHELVAKARCLEIHGFLDFPQCLGQLLKHAEFVVLIENSFIRFLSDLGADNIKAMKVCWIQRCNNMEHVICAEKVEETGKPEESVKSKGKLEENFADILTSNLEILWISDVTTLRSISNRNSQGISFKTLKSLYLEYCPELSVIFSSSQQLSKLEILHVKYCQNLGTLFEDESAELPNLHSLHLWGLPELKKISCTVQSLHTLRVGDCPLMENIFDSNIFPKKLESLQVKFCDKMKTIIQGSMSMLKLDSLKSLNFMNLPVLESIGAHLPLLKKQDTTILGCPKLSKCDFNEAQKEPSQIPE